MSGVKLPPLGEKEATKTSSPTVAMATSSMTLGRKLTTDAAPSVYDITLHTTTHVKDPWKNKRVNWVNVFLTIMTYGLVLSDVMRAGAKTIPKMRVVGMGIYAYFGSYAYPLLTYKRDPYNLKNVTVYTGGGTPLPNTRIWSYVFDTTSSEMRSITREFDSTGNYVLQCMNYQIKCPHMGLFEVKDTFDVMERVINSLSDIPTNRLPKITPRLNGPDSYQFTRRAGVLKRRYVDILYEYLVYKFVESFEMISYRITHFPEVTVDFDPCADRFDRPFLCDGEPITDYTISADPISPDSVAVGFVSDFVRDMARGTYNASHSLASNITVDVTFFEGYTHPMTFTGGMVVAATSGFEIVMLTRVRDCSSGECKTIRLDDFRFEGGRIITDIDDWNNLVAILRISAQVYFFIRIVSLFAACYFGFPPNERSLSRSCFLFFSEVPSHVVAYGSPLPVFLYAIAMCIDGPITNTIVQFGGVRLQGSWLDDPKGIYHLICILMRRQWLMAAIAMIWVKLQTTSAQWDRHVGFLSIRGHIFGILSTMSMILGYHHPNFRDSRVLTVARENPNTAVLDIGVFSRDLSNQKLSGVYVDVFSLLCCAIVFAVVVVILRILFNIVMLFLGDAVNMKRFARIGTGPELQAATDSRRLSDPIDQIGVNRGNDRGSIFFCRSDLLPSTCGTLWGQMGMTCGWDNDVALTVTGQEKPRSHMHHKEVLLLMNIVQLSEPYNFLMMKAGFKFVDVYTYRDVDSKVMFSVAEDLERVHAIAQERKANKFHLVSKQSIHDLAFYELVACR